MRRKASTPLFGVAALLVTAGAVALLLAGAGDAHRSVNVELRDATNVIPGQSVRVAGVEAGTVSGVDVIDRGRRVRVRLDIADRFWPLRRGTTMAVRWGGTISYSNRYVALHPARDGAPYADGATLPASSLSSPGEFDATLRVFQPSVRRDLRAMIDRGGPSLDAAAPALRASLTSAPQALRQADHLLDDVVADHEALSTLVGSTRRVVSAVQVANPRVGQAVTGAATTLKAIATEASALQTTLSRTAPVLRSARSTLGRTSRVLGTADELTERLAPGITQLRAASPSLNRTLETLEVVAPDATGTLRTVRGALPRLNPLLRLVGQRMPQLGSIGRQAAEQLRCIRPYTPDIVAFMTNWADFMSHNDGADRYLRANVEVPLPMVTNLDSRTPAEVVEANPQLDYAFPRPPGYNAGQSWFLPECGVDMDVLDPAKDPEVRNTYSVSDKPAVSSEDAP